MTDPDKTKDIGIFYKLCAAPVYMVTLTKSGCTFLKNLFYYIDQGHAHPLGNRIHEDESKLLRARESDYDDMMASPYRYMVIRDPVDRFLSMYYDKIVNPTDESTFWFRDEIGREIGMNFAPEMSLAAHQDNMILLIEWLDLNIHKKTDHFVDFHWRPQVYKYRRAKKFDPILIPLGVINDALPSLLEPVLPNIRAQMAAVKNRNKSVKPFNFAESRTDALVDRISEIYARDLDLVDRAQKYWKQQLD